MQHLPSSTNKSDNKFNCKDEDSFKTVTKEYLDQGCNQNLIFDEYDCTFEWSDILNFCIGFDNTCNKKLKQSLKLELIVKIFKSNENHYNAINIFK